MNTAVSTPHRSAPVPATAARVAAVLGLAVAVTGLAVMAGWLLRIETLVGVVPGHRMTFNSAAGLAVAGLALACGSKGYAGAQRAVALAGFFALVLSQHLFGVSLGIDWPRLHAWLPASRDDAGRTSVLNCLAFLSFSAAILLARDPRAHASILVVRALTGVVGGLGLFALIGQVLHFDVIFDVTLFAQISPLSAAAFIALGTGLWLGWRRAPWHGTAVIVRDDVRIVFAGALITTIVAATAGVAGIASLQHSAERALLEGLARTQASRAALFSQAIDRHSAFVESIAARTDIVRLHVELAAEPENEAHVALLHMVAETLVTRGLGFVEFRDIRGERIASAGHSLIDAEFRIALRGKQARTLAWNRELLLQMEVPVTDSGIVIGQVIAEQPLRDLEQSVFRVDDLGATGEVAVCGPRSAHEMFCLPTRFHAKPFAIGRHQHGVPLPMAYALEGRQGTVQARDYRQREVSAAFGPIANLGLGMVAKLDTSELYAPVRERLTVAIPLLAAVIAMGIILLHRQVRPLARRLAESEARARESEERLRLALDNSRLALWDFDVSSGRVYLSEQWQAMLGNAPAASEVAFAELQNLVHPDDLPQLSAHLEDVLKGVAHFYDIEHRVRTSSGEWIWIRSRGRVVARAPDGKALRLTGTNAEITRRKLAELQLAHEARHDTLTGLPNRALFSDRLARAMARSRRHRGLMGVMYLDIDRFKSINDTLGHDVGDLLLKAFARRLLECVRATDTVARLGGDEFAVILDELKAPSDGAAIAEKIVLAMRPAFRLGQQELKVSTSVGLALYAHESDVTTDALVKKADEALYAAKAAGRNNYKVAA